MTDKIRHLVCKDPIVFRRKEKPVAVKSATKKVSIVLLWELMCHTVPPCGLFIFSSDDEK